MKEQLNQKKTKLPYPPSHMVSARLAGFDINLNQDFSQESTGNNYTKKDCNVGKEEI